MRSPELPPLAVYQLFLMFFYFYPLYFFSCTAYRRLAGPPLRVSGEVCAVNQCTLHLH